MASGNGNGRKHAAVAGELAVSAPLPVTAVDKIKQPHGGALYAGGVPGHKGSGGQPPAEVRRRARSSFYARIPVLEKIADDKSKGESSADRIRALATLGNIGMSSAIAADDVREALRSTLAEIRRLLSDEDADRVITAIRPYWRGDA